MAKQQFDFAALIARTFEQPNPIRDYIKAHAEDEAFSEANPDRTTWVRPASEPERRIYELVPKNLEVYLLVRLNEFFAFECIAFARAPFDHSAVTEEEAKAMWPDDVTRIH